MRKQLTKFVIAAALAVSAGSFSAPATAVSTGVVISQIYGGGGNSGATLKNDFVELFNRGTTTVSLAGWSVQYAAAGGTTWQVTLLSGSIAPGQYFLVQEAAGAGGTTTLPPPDATGTIAMSATSGKVALVSGAAALSGACPSAGIIDFVGFGASATCFEGAGPTATLSNTTAALRKSNGAQDTDDNGGDFSTGAPAPRNSGSPPNAVPTLLRINQIQGSGVSSPWTGKLVETTGIVTGVKSNGFFIQSQPADVDADPATSEGVFVFTAVHPATASGDYVDVVGTVQEFFQSGASASMTEIGGPTVTVLSSGNQLPDPVDLAALGLPQPAGGFFQLERLEGMRVRLDSLTVVEGNTGTVNEAIASASTFGDFYGVRTGTARPFREPGIEAPAPPPAPPCCIPAFDGNPERLRVDSTSLGGVKIVVTPGAVLSNLVGPLDYNFAAYSINIDGSAATSVSNNDASATSVPLRGATELTVGSFNMEHFFDTTDDPEPFDVALTPAAYANRLNKASLAIRNVLRMPDVLGVEEVEHLAVLQDLASKISLDAVAAGQPDPQYFPILFEGNDPSGIDSGVLVRQDGRVTIVDFTQVGKDATFNNPPELMNDRPPVVLRAVVNVPGGAPLPITVIVNHLKSLIGVDTLDATGARNRAKRAGQAEYLANLIQQHQAAGEHVVAVGDFNAFQFNDGYVDVIGTVKGVPAPADQVLLATNSGLVAPPLEDLVDTAPEGERYSYSFDGNLQELDHVLVTQEMMAFAPHLEYGRMDAGFPESYRGDPSRPERLSDHDPIVAYFRVPALTSLTFAAPTGEAGFATPITFTLRSAVDGSGIGGAPLTITIGSSTQSATTDAGGVATVSAVLGAGTYPVSASFAGDPAAFLLGSQVAGTLTIRDTMPPTIGTIAPSQTSMWPPTKRMTPIAISATASDVGDPAPVCSVVGVSSNEGTSADWTIEGALAVSLRADRDGKGSGRTYTITVRCVDASGNAASAATTVIVPHDQGT